MRSAVYVIVSSKLLDPMKIAEIARKETAHFNNPICIYDDIENQEKPGLELLKQLDKELHFDLIRLWIGIYTQPHLSDRKRLMKERNE